MITIDSEFQSLIPALSAEEYGQLEENILHDGIRDALIVWDGILLDGHNRYKIAQEHGLTFETQEMNFASREDAKIWVIQNQFGRRNLIPYQRSMLELKLEEVIAEQAKERSLANLKQNTEVPNLAPRGRTRDILSKAAGVSHGTLAKVKKIERDAPGEIKAAARAGEISIDKAYQAVKREEKKAEIQAAEEKIAEEYRQDETKAILYLGDSFSYTPKEQYKLLLTDPPYKTDVENIDKFAQSWLPKALQYVRADGFAYVFIGAYPDEMRAYLNIEPPAHMELVQVLVWTYKNTLGNNPKDRYKQNYQACLFYRGKDAPALDCPLTNEQWAVQEINAPDGRQFDRYHAWQKPMEIAERFIRHSTKAGDTVFDPFACTGTFLLAAAKLGRKAYGFEINPENAEIAIKRGCVYG